MHALQLSETQLHTKFQHNRPIRYRSLATTVLREVERRAWTAREPQRQGGGEGRGGETGGGDEWRGPGKRQFSRRRGGANVLRQGVTTGCGAAPSGRGSTTLGMTNTLGYRRTDCNHGR